MKKAVLIVCVVLVGVSTGWAKGQPPNLISCHNDRGNVTLRSSETEKQKPTPEFVEVHTEDLRNLPKGESYLVDLTLDGVVYVIEAEAQLADTRITVHSLSSSQTTLGDWLGNDAPDASERHLMLGHPVDLAAVHRGIRGPVFWSCGDFVCRCTAGTDCTDMFLSGICGRYAWCDDDSRSCYCTR
jgi:hypothetical protein